MKKQKSEPSHFMQVLQKGYMAIEKHGIIEQALVLVGPTKVGKTTILHMMAKSNLKGDYNNIKHIVYKAEQPPQALISAEIGGLQAVSQTKIPNIILLQMGKQKQKIYVVDLPGFMDSGGCFETISNRFYIRSLFEKLKRIKFVLTTTYIDIRQTKDRFLLSIKEFFAFFNNSRQTINKIIDSICLYVTCVPEHCQTITITQMLQQGEFGKLNPEQRGLYKTMISQMKRKNRIFIFQQAVLGQTLKVNDDLADKVNKSMNTWWQRRESEGKVQMSEINLCLLEINDREILTQFEESLNQLSKYIAEILKKDIRKQFYQEILHQFIKNVIFEEKKLNIMDRIEKRPEKDLWQLMNSKEQYEELRNKKMTSADSFNSDANLLCNGVTKTFVYKKATLRLNKICKHIIKQCTAQNSLEQVQIFIQAIRSTMKIMMSIVSAPVSLKQKFMNYMFDLYSKLQILQSINSVIFSSLIRNSRSQIARSLQQFHQSFNTNLKNSFMLSDNKDTKDNKDNLDIPILKNILNSLNQISEKDFNSNQRELQFIKIFMQEALSQLLKLDEQMLDEQDISNQQLTAFRKSIEIKIIFVQFKILENKLYQVDWENIKQGFNQSKRILQMMEGCRQAVLSSTGQEQPQIQLMQIKFLQAIAEYIKKKNPILSLTIYSMLLDANEVLEIRQQIQKSRLTNWRALSLQQKGKICDQIYKNAENAYIYGRKELSMSKSQLLYSLAQKMGSQKYINKASGWLHFLRQGAENTGQTKGGSNKKMGLSRRFLNETEQARNLHQMRVEVGLFTTNIENQTVLKIISMFDQKVDYADFEKLLKQNC